jgi:hypothetical protein
MSPIKTITIISFKYKANLYPLIKVIDNNFNQVVVIFRDRPIHLTLHKEKRNILMTIYDENKPLSQGNKARIEIAQKLGYKDPERHGKYITHQILVKCINDNGYYLMGRTTNLMDCPVTNRYGNTIITCDKNKFLLELYLSRPENIHSYSNGNYISTSLGDIYFRINENKEIMRYS